MKSRRWLMLLLIATVVLLIVPAGWTLWTRHRVDDAQSRCRAAGLAMTLEEIRPPAVVDADNASPLLEKIAVLIEAPAFTESKPGHDPIAEIDKFRTAEVRAFTAEEMAAVGQALAMPAVQEILALARAAAAKPGYDAHLDYELGPALVLKNLPALRRSVSLLGASARLAAQLGDAERAASELLAMLALAEFLRTEPILISQLTRMACVGMTIDVLEKIVATRGLSLRGREAISARLKMIDWRIEFVRALDAERIVYGGYCFERLGQIGTIHNLASAFGNDPGLGLTVVAKVYGLSGFLRLDYADYLDRMREMTLEFRNASHTPTEQVESLKKICSEIPSWHVLTRIVTPTLNAVGQSVWQGRQKLAVTAVGLALERYREQHGGYPADLSALRPDLMPEIPLDAFSGQPLRYEPSARGALVYSIGPNLRDDGGTRDPSTQKDDLAWRAGEKPAAATP